MSGPNAGDRPIGRLEGRLLRWLGREAVVSEVKTLSADFRLITLTGEALREVAWQPGQKVQVSVSGMRVARTYTPLDWDSERGTTRLLAWLHGEAPGSAWVRAAKVGDPCPLFGPRRSIDVPHDARELVVFGDETALGLAYALAASRPDRGTTCLFESSDIAQMTVVAARFGLGASHIVPRTADESHLTALQERLSEPAIRSATFVLAGRAPAIQIISRSLKVLGVPTSRLKVKAYWAPGKTGLD